MTASRQHGFTLIEALIALLVLSIGLLSVAALQLKSLQSAHAGYQRAAASLAAQDAVEMLWSRFNAANGQCHELESEAGWESRWQQIIPGLDGDVSSRGDECEFDITLSWDDARLGESGEANFTYTTRLPGSGP